MKKKTILCFVLSLCMVAGSFSSMAADVSTETTTEAATEVQSADSDSSVDASAAEEEKEETTAEAQTETEAQEVVEPVQDDTLLKVTYESEKAVLDWKEWTEKYGLKEDDNTYVYNVVVTDPSEITKNEDGEEEEALVEQIAVNDKTTCDLSLDELTAGKTYKASVYYTEASKEDVAAAAEDETLLIKKFDKEDIAGAADLSSVSTQADAFTYDGKSVQTVRSLKPTWDSDTGLIINAETGAYNVVLLFSASGYTVPSNYSTRFSSHLFPQLRYFVYRKEKLNDADDSTYSEWQLLDAVQANFNSGKKKTDKTVEAGKTYQYKVVLAQATGASTYDPSKWGPCVIDETAANFSQDSEIYTVSVPGTASETEIDGEATGGFAAPTGLAGTPGSKSITLNWDAVADAEGYQLQRKLSTAVGWPTSGALDLVGANRNTYPDTGLSYGIYTYRVRAYRTNTEGVTEYSEWATKDVNLCNPSTVKIMSYKAKLRANNIRMFTTHSSMNVVTRVKKGTSVIAYQKAGQRYYCKVTSTGKTGWINVANLTFTGVNAYSTDKYNKDTLLSYVNNKGFTSSTKYFILVNTYTEQCTVFEGTGKAGQWSKILYSEKCCTGKYSTRSPMGSRKIVNRKPKAGGGGTYEKYFVAYLVCKTGWNGFHSRLLRSGTTNYYYTGSRADVGKPVTNGCIRCAMDEITFIYKSCKNGTGVYIW